MADIHNLAEVDPEGRLIAPAALAQIAELARSEAANVAPRQATPAELVAGSVVLPPGAAVISSQGNRAGWEFKNLGVKDDARRLTMTAGTFIQVQKYGTAEVFTGVNILREETVRLQIDRPTAGYPATGGGWIIAAGPMPEDEGPTAQAYTAANDLMVMFSRMGLSVNMGETANGVALVLQDQASDPLSYGEATHHTTLDDVPTLLNITKLPNPENLTIGGWGRVFEPQTPAQMNALLGG